MLARETVLYSKHCFYLAINTRAQTFRVPNGAGGAVADKVQQIIADWEREQFQISFSLIIHRLRIYTAPTAMPLGT